MAGPTPAGFRPQAPDGLGWPGPTPAGFRPQAPDGLGLARSGLGVARSAAVRLRVSKACDNRSSTRTASATP
ncbi:hypothetical protein PV779_67115, partial [Streptomyces sp. ID01-9D]|nr:hypothetical protein [Streptomyces sp. ID01-9D]